MIARMIPAVRMPTPEGARIEDRADKRDALDEGRDRDLHEFAKSGAKTNRPHMP